LDKKSLKNYSFFLKELVADAAAMMLGWWMHVAVSFLSRGSTKMYTKRTLFKHQIFIVIILSKYRRQQFHGIRRSSKINAC
jgi:hypothetical protein